MSVSLTKLAEAEGKAIELLRLINGEERRVVRADNDPFTLLPRTPEQLATARVILKALRAEARFDSFIAPAAARLDDADWKESDHPRGPDGKFTSSSGGTAAAESYKASLNGKKPSFAGLMKHLLSEGKWTKNEVLEAAKEVLGTPDDKAWYYGWYKNDLKKKGVAIPEQPTESQWKSPEGDGKEEGAGKPEDGSDVPAPTAEETAKKESGDAQYGGVKPALSAKFGEVETLAGQGPVEGKAQADKILDGLAKIMNDKTTSVPDKLDAIKVFAKNAKTGSVTPEVGKALGAAFQAAQSQLNEKYDGAPAPALNSAQTPAKAAASEGAEGAGQGSPTPPKKTLAEHPGDSIPAKFKSFYDEGKDLYGHDPNVQKQLGMLADNWDKVLPENQTPIAEALGKLAAAKTPDEIGALKPLDGGGMAKQTFNATLAAVQAHVGKGPGAAPYKPATKAENAVYEAAQNAPPAFVDKTSRLVDKDGNKVTARLVADTDRIPPGQYATVTSAYAGKKNAMSLEVSKAMEAVRLAQLDAMTPEQRNAAAFYKGSGYKQMNIAILKGGGSGSTAKTIAALDAAIENAVVPADTPVFRGMRCSLKDLSGFDDAAQSVGRCFVHKNFASVSRDENISKNFGERVMLEMTLAAGTPGLVLGSQVGGENEIVLNRDGVFRIDKVVQEAGKMGSGPTHRLYVTYMGRKQ